MESVFLTANARSRAGINRFHCQTPAGYEIIDGRFFPLSLSAVIFTPSFPYRLAHTVSAFLITTGFVILAVGAYYIRRGMAIPESRIMMRMSLLFLALLAPLQIVLGDLHGLNILKHQPAKVAAMGGRWETGRGVAASLIAIPDKEAEKNYSTLPFPSWPAGTSPMMRTARSRD